MKRILTAVLLLLAAITGAQAQSAPANLPYHTVYGRMGGVPGDTGPGQAIPFSTLQHIFAGPVRLASSYGKASWCLNLIAALADIGPGPGTVLIDSTNEVPTICAATSTIMVGASKHIEFIDGALYSLNQTIQLGSGSSLQMLGGGMANSFTSAIGNRLLWQGAASGVMVRVFDANHAWVKDAVLDCGGVTNCTALHYDSDNNPISTMNFFENLTLVGAHVGVLVGNAGTSHPTADQCNVNPSQSGCHEMDFATFKNVYILGNCSDTTGEGFHINSQNSLQQSTIDTFIVQCVNIGIHQVFSAGSNTNIRNGNGGSTVGTSPVFIKTDSGGAIGMNLFNNETEGGWTYAVHDSGCNGSSLNFETWQQNVFSDPVLSDGCAQIVSNSNASSGGVGNFVASGSSAVTSIGDAPDGAWTGNVSYYPTATHPLPANNGGTGKAVYAVGDLLYADATTTLARLADVATTNALISGGIGVAPSWGKIGNSTLVNASTTVNGQTCTLGSTCTVTATAANTLTFGTHLTSGGASYNGSTPITITPDATSANTASTMVARDGSGNFSAGTISAALSGNATTATSATSATNATNTAITEDVATNATMFPTWVTANTGNLPQKTTSTKLTFNPSTGVLSSTSFTGAGTGLTGTAASLTAGNVTNNANLTGAITSVGNAASLGSFTSAQLAGALTNETGSGFAVFNSLANLIAPVFQDFSDNTKQFQLILNGITASATRSWTVPNSDDTFAGVGATQELTNKTLTASAAKGTWTTSGTWTLPAHTLGGTVTGGGSTVTNVALTSSTYNGNTWTAGTGTLTLGAGKTATVSNTLTLTGTDASSIAFGTGGTIGAVGYSATGQIAATATNDDAAAGKVGEYVSNILTTPAVTGATVTITIATPAVVTWTGHGLCYANAAGCSSVVTATAVVFTTTGALPTGITAGTTYYAVAIDANTFNIATTCANALAGTFVATSGSQSGTQSVNVQVSLANNTVLDLACARFPAGDYDVHSAAAFTTAATTTVTAQLAGISLTSNTFDATFGRFSKLTMASAVPNGLTTMAVPSYRMSFSSTTNVFFIGYSLFGTSTQVASGMGGGRRVR